MLKKKTSFKKIAKNLTGFSTPFFGVSWEPPADQRDKIRQLITFLEDRRSLYYDRFLEYSPWVIESILEIRKEITNTLKNIPDDSEAVVSLKTMRAACRKFLDQNAEPRLSKMPPRVMHENMWVSLGELRATFGMHLARLCVAYGIDAPGELAQLFPAEDK